MSWSFSIYLVVLHVLAIPGLYFALAFGLTAFLNATTNPLTGQTKPRARGLGWLFIGLAIGGMCGAACWLLG